MPMIPGQGSVGLRARQIADGMAQHGRALDLSEAPPPGGLQLNIAVERMSDDLVQTLRSTQIRSTQPSYHAQPYSAKGFDEFGSASLLAGATFTNIVTFVVPQNHIAVLKGFGQDADDLGAFSDLIWRITVDGVPQQPYTALAYQISTLAVLRECQIIVSGGTIALQARNPGAVTWVPTGCLKGWYWVPSQRGADGSFLATITD